MSEEGGQDYALDQDVDISTGCESECEIVREFPFFSKEWIKNSIASLLVAIDDSAGT